MKKKLVGLFVAVVFILTVAVCLTACAGDPELSNIVVSVNNAEHESSYSFGDFEIGTTPSLPYKIYAKFTDGTKRELSASEYTTEYKFNGSKIDALPSSYDIGAYEIKVGYGDRTLTISFNVVYASRSYQTVLVGNTVWAYGGAQPEIKLADNTITLEADDYRIIEKSKVANSAALTVAEYGESLSYDKESPVAPGEYYLFIAVPQVGNYAEAYSELKEVRVNKANVTVENAADLKVIYSYGSDTQGNIKASDLISSFEENPIVKCGSEDFQAITWAFAEPNKELNASNNGETLQVVFTLEEGYDAYYNAPAPIDVALEINKASIQKPTVFDERVTAIGANNKIDIYVGEQSIGTGFDDWKAVNLVITKPDSTKETVDISTESNTHIYLDYKTVAGTYTYTLSLKDKVNYKWSDGTTEDVVKEIVVEGSDICGKHVVFTDWKTVNPADGSEVTDENNDFVLMAESFRVANLGLVDGAGNPVDPADAVPATAYAETNGTVSGTCDFGGGTFDELISGSEDSDPAPIYYTYDPSRENTVEMFSKNGDGAIIEESKMVGNLVGNTLTLKGNVPDNSGFVWVFTFTIVEPQA